MAEFAENVNPANISSLHRAALNFALAGIPVFPCKVGLKKPAINGSFNAATTDLATINRWWHRADWNIGVCPEHCGWAVIDFEANADPAYLAKFPLTYTVGTPHDGRHFYYEGSIASSVAKLAPRVDTRGIGGYVLVPPSIVDGRRYRILRPGDTVPLPEWVKLPKTKPVANGHDHEADLPGNVARAIKYLEGLELVREREGADARTYEVCCALKDLGLSADKTYETMLEHYRIAPRDSRLEAFLRAKIAHAYEYGQNTPGIHAAPSSAKLASSAAIQEVLRAQSQSRLDSVMGSVLPMLKTEWAWPQRIPLAMVSLLAGHAKLGKSTILLDIAARVTIAAAWPDGRGKAPKGTVIYFSGEDDIQRTLMPRFVACGGDLTKICFVRATYNEDGNGKHTFSLANDLDELAKKIAELGDVVLVIFDPISSYFGNADTFRNSEVRSVLEPLVRFASEHNITVIANTHLGKANKGPANLRVLDSVAFTATVRSIYMVTRDPKDDGRRRRLFVPAGGNLAKEIGGIAFTIGEKFVQEGITGTFIQWEAGEVTDTADDIVARLDEQQRKPSPELDKAIAWVCEYLANGAQLTARMGEDAEAANIASDTLRRAKRKLGVVTGHKGMGTVNWSWLPG